MPTTPPPAGIDTLERTYDKPSMLRLTGIPENNLPYLVSKGLVRTVERMRRGKRPRYTMVEVIKLGIMEKLRSKAGVAYHDGRAYVDTLETIHTPAASEPDGSLAQGFLNVLQYPIYSDHVIWLLIVDGKPHKIWLLQLRENLRGLDEFGRMATFAMVPADSFDTCTILNLGDLFRAVTQAP